MARDELAAIGALDARALACCVRGGGDSGSSSKDASQKKLDAELTALLASVSLLHLVPNFTKNEVSCHGDRQKKLCAVCRCVAVPALQHMPWHT